MKIISSSNTAEVARLLDRDARTDRRVERRAAAIIADVRRRGDEAVRDYARTLDEVRGPIEVTAAQMTRGASQVPPDVRRAITLAARNIRKVAAAQRPSSWRLQTAPGVTVEQRVTPLARVGCYVPGGRYPLPSTLC